MSNRTKDTRFETIRRSDKTLTTSVLSNFKFVLFL